MIFGCNHTGTSVLLGTTMTDSDGNYYFNSSNTSPPLTDGEAYRIEFDLPTGTSLEAACGNRMGILQFSSFLHLVVM